MSSKFIKRTYWRDIFYQASGNTVAQVLGIIGIPILTRLYSPEVFAYQGMFLQGVMLVAGIITWRYEYFFQLLKSEAESHLLMSWIIKMGGLTALALTVLVFLIEYFGLFVGNLEGFSNYAYFIPFTAFLVSLSLSFQHESQRSGDFVSSGISEVCAKFLYVLSGVALSWISSGIGLLLTSAFSAIGKLAALHKYIFVFLTAGKQPLAGMHPRRTYLARANGMVLSGVIVSLSSAIPVFFIGAQYGANELGYFTLVVTTIFIPSSLIGAAIGNVFYQRAAQMWAVEEYILLKRLWIDTVFKLAIIGVPLYATIFFISEFAYPLVFGEQWAQAGSLGKILSVSAFFSFMAGPLDRLSLVLGLSFYLPMMHMVRLLLVAGTSYLFYLSGWGAVEYVIAFAFIMAFVYLLDLFLCRLLFSVVEKRFK